MFVNNNLYDRLKTCVVGQTWPPEFYRRIDNAAVREPLQRIAQETQQDLDDLAGLLQDLGVTVLRPDPAKYIVQDWSKPIPPPPMMPGDHMCMIGNVFVHSVNETSQCYQSMFDQIHEHNLTVTLPESTACAAMNFQLDNQVVVGRPDNDDWNLVGKLWHSLTARPIRRFPLHGHVDGWFSPVSPGLIVSDLPSANQALVEIFYRKYFPDWRVVYCSGGWQTQSWSINDWQEANPARWWVAGEENNHEFHAFVDRYLQDWVGNAQESVFDVNIIVIDHQTVIIRNTTNQVLLDALHSHGITVYQTPFRHATFWDGCVNCVTLPLSRG
jgi:hypothetical protein